MSARYILILNCGSSSLKFSVIDLESGAAVMHGSAQQLGSRRAILACDYLNAVISFPLSIDSSYTDVLSRVIAWMVEHPAVYQCLIAVGHRVVHGGEVFTQATLLDKEKIVSLRGLSHLAPLHNPANLLGVEAALSALPNLPQVAVFDTAFHQSLPEKAYLYALPFSLYQTHKIRRYGFHGSSYAYVLSRAVQLLDIDVNNSKLVVAHLGNGASVCAIKNGKSIDTSMGFTPLEGLVMGTRCGDLDPSLPEYLSQHLHQSLGEVMNLLNKQSGLLGLSEKTNDFRELELCYAAGEVASRRAIDIFTYRLAKYIASYTVPLGGLDAIVFTGGIGENSILVRELTLNYLNHLGVQVDIALNAKMISGSEGLISLPGRVDALVVPTNEEWMIAQEVVRLIA